MKGTLVVSEKASRLQVDHRLPLRIYYRAADSLLRQARIYRKENNLIDLYVLLLRFSSLVMETIPQHRDYRAFLGREKTDFRKRLLDVLSELESLKPLVQSEVSRYNNVYAPASPSLNGLSSTNSTLGRSQSLSRIVPGKDSAQALYNWEVPRVYDSNKQHRSSAGLSWQSDLSNRPTDSGRRAYPQSGYNWNGDITSQTVPSNVQHAFQISYNGIGDLNGRPFDSRSQEHSQGGYSLSVQPSSKPVYPGALLPPYSSTASSTLEDQMSKLSFGVPTPTSDSLSRHSFLPPTVRRATASNVLTTKVNYPSLIDSSPTVMPSLDENWRTPAPMEPLKAVAEPVFYNEADMLKFDEKHSSLVESAVSLHSELNRQPCPPPVAAEVHTVTAASVTLPSHENGFTEGHLSDVLMPPPVPRKFSDDSVQSRKPKQLHIAGNLLPSFLKVANGNTRDNLETCGVLAGSLKESVFYVTTLIIPKQEATANSCSTLNEEDIFEFQDKHDLFQFGWIHTHPSQKCFMSSIDLHTHYSYQVMLPEAVAIVMAPTDSSRRYGIFRLAEPNGIKVIQSCDQRGFHPHSEPEGGGSIYEQCGHVVLDPQFECDVVDLR